MIIKKIRQSKLAIAIFFSMLVLAFTFFNLISTDSKAAYHDHMALEGDFSLNSYKFASLEASGSSLYPKTDTFISKVQESRRKFTLIGVSWLQYSPENTKVIPYIRFKDGISWTDWIEPEAEDLSMDLESNRRFFTAATNETDMFQFKFELLGDGSVSPVISDLQWDLIQTEEIEEYKNESADYSSKLTDTLLKVNSRSLGIVSRKDWGADEKWRYLAYNDPEYTKISSQSDDFYTKYADELIIKKTVETDKNGNPYLWPLQYPDKIRKIVVHHTATTSNLDNPEQAIRDIYYYHAVVNGWGDIGYNYLIDKDGRIYEGRYGGESVVGAHVARANLGSIGIAVLGNYQEASPTNATIKSLEKLIAAKAKLHNLDIDGYSYFRGDYLPNIVGHRDLAATACPGENLYSELSTIRKDAKSYDFSSDTGDFSSADKEKYVKDYDYLLKADLPALSLDSGDSEWIEIKLQNIGTKTWNSDTYLALRDDDNMGRALVFTSSTSDQNIAAMQEDRVAPGKFASFKFKIKAKADTGSYKLEFAPIIQGNVLTDSSFNMIVNLGGTVSSEKSSTQIWTSKSETVENSTTISNIDYVDSVIRVKISSFSANPLITANEDYYVYSGGEKLFKLDANERIEIRKVGQKFRLEHDGKIVMTSDPIRLISTDNAIFEIINFEHRPQWNTKLNDNKYRGILEVNTEDSKLILINEIEIEDYLKGLGEVSNYDDQDKMKTIVVAARTYAHYYIKEDRKFDGKPYDLDDDPEVSQKYLGYGLEQRAPNLVKAVDETMGEIVTYNGKLVKTPYFNQSDGSFTKDPADVWGWEAPHLKPVDDSFCDADYFNGHGVGLSGCGASSMAELGYDYKEILKYYYTDIEIERGDSL